MNEHRIKLAYVRHCKALCIPSQSVNAAEPPVWLWVWQQLKSIVCSGVWHLRRRQWRHQSVFRRTVWPTDRNDNERRPPRHQCQVRADTSITHRQATRYIYSTTPTYTRCRQRSWRHRLQRRTNLTPMYVIVHCRCQLSRWICKAHNVGNWPAESEVITLGLQCAAKKYPLKFFCHFQSNHLEFLREA